MSKHALFSASMLPALAIAALATFAAASPAHADRSAIFPNTIAVPNGFRPEGIAIGHGATVFTGSIGTGAIFAASLVTGEGKELVPAQPGRAALGLSYDPRTDLLYVAGGPTGAAYVYDAGTGAEVAVYQLTTATPTFINDQIVTADAVYFTDSNRAVLYKVDLSRRNRPVPGVTEIALGGDFTLVPGAFNANGIVASPFGRSLIIISSALGTLFNVDPDTGVAKTIDLGGVTLTAGDGLFLRGDDLVVVQNQLNQISIIDLDRRFASGTVKQTITDTRFDIPTAAASFLGTLYTVNARFSTPPTADTTYTIEKVVR